MKTGLVGLTIAIAFVLPSSAQGRLLQISQMLEDFHLFRTSLEQGDSGIYRYVDKSEVDQAFDRSLAKINHPMNVLEFYRILAPAVSSIECGHTGITPPVDMQKEINTSVPLLPVEVRILDNRVYVFRDYAERGLVGTEILKINGTPTATILSVLFSSTSADGKIPTMRPWRLGHGRTFSKMLYVLLGLHSPFQVEYRDAKDVIRTVDLPGMEISKMAVNHNDRQTEIACEQKEPIDLASFAFLDKGKIGLLHITMFEPYADAKHKVKMSDFIDNVFQQLSRRQAAALIIDVRDNGGGEDELGERLFSYLAMEPYYYYDDLVINARKFDFAKYARFKFEKLEIPADKVKRLPDGKFSMINHPNLGIHQPRHPHFNGKTYILMNGGSFSTTSEFLTIANYHKVATFIGEEEGGAFYGNTSGPEIHVVLPNSGIIVGIRLLTYYLAAKGDHEADRGVIPDYTVKPSIEDLVAGKDKDLALALQMARTQTAARSN